LLACSLRQSQFAVLRNYDLMALPAGEKENTQHLVDRWVRIAAHAAIIHDHEELASTLKAAHLLCYVYKMSGAAIVGAHDMQFAIVKFISGTGIELETDVGILREAKLFHVAIPVPNPDEKLFDVTARRIHAQVPVGHIELQDAVVQKRPHLRSYIHAAIAVAVFRRHQRSALCYCRARKKKHAGYTNDHTCD